MLEQYKINANVETLDYLLPYEIEEELKHKTLQKIIYASKCNKQILLTANGTVSVYSLINYFKQISVKKIAIVAPVYFSVPLACKNLDVDYKIFYLDRSNSGEYFLNKDSYLEICGCDVVWITNPIYCTGVYYSASEIYKIREILELGKTVVLDESLAVNGRELIKLFNNYKNIVSIVSPHKSICINSVKFSAIIAERNTVKCMENWVDIISGGLSNSNIVAVKHFHSSNYELEKKMFLEDTVRGSDKIKKICNDFNLEFDGEASGCFRTLYLKT